MGSLAELCLHAVPGHRTSGGKAEHLWALGSMVCGCVKPQGCNSDPQPPTTVAKGGARGRGERLNRAALSLEKGRGALAEGLTCTPGGSAAGPGPGPRTAGATLAPARCGTAAGLAPSENGAAGSAHRGAGHGARRMKGVRVPPGASWPRGPSPCGAAPSQELSCVGDQPASGLPSARGWRGCHLNRQGGRHRGQKGS